MDKIAKNNMENQYHAAHDHTAITKYSDQEIFEITGPGYVEFLNNYNTQNIIKLQNNHMAYGAFLTQKGKLISDCWIWKLSNKILITLENNYEEKVLEHLKVYLSLSDVEFKRVDPQIKHFMLFGAKSKEILSQVLEFPFTDSSFEIKIISYQEQNIIVGKNNRLGIWGYEILLPQILFDEIYDKFLFYGALPLENKTSEMIRIESGIPKMGQDMTEENLVAEVGLDKRATSFNKGCYLGQETTARVQSQGHVNKQLTLLKFHDNIEGNESMEVFMEDQKIGKITSLSPSIKWGGTIGLGILSTKALQEQDHFNIRHDNHTYLATRIKDGIQY